MPAQRLSGRENGGRFFHYLGGLHLKALLEKGHEVTVIDNLFLGRESLVDKRAKFMKGDLTDKDFVLKTVKGFDVVFHLAGVSDIREGTKDRGVFMKKNVASTQNVLEAMQLNGVEK
ncbi:MAG TPA: NAD-dependent epimerase/dehydratase family protein, partial [archaeon]|nr:NAD-dependent epimerase/dehydratase family protein [archaeon]